MANLGPLHLRVFAALADMQPTPTLFGGAALIGAYLDHRTTRDTDWVWYQRQALDELVPVVADRLRHAELTVADVVRAVSFHRFVVSLGEEVLLIDLVADPGTPLEPAVAVQIAGISVHVPTRHNLLVDKLCALLSRQEGRDLVDVHALLTAGADLDRAVADAPKRDAGYSAMTLVWVLRGWQMASVAKSAGWLAERTALMAAFRDELVQRLTASAADDVRGR